MTKQYIHQNLYKIANDAATYGHAVGKGVPKEATDPMVRSLIAHIDKFGEDIFRALEAKEPKCPHKSVMMG